MFSKKKNESKEEKKVSTPKKVLNICEYVIIAIIITTAIDITHVNASIINNIKIILPIIGPVESPDHPFLDIKLSPLLLIFT